MPADFTQFSNYNKDANFQLVKYGSDSDLLEVELNEMQEIHTEARAEIVRQSIPSGFTTLSDLDYTTMATNPNQIKMLSDSIAWVNGYKITIPAGTVITLDAPPTSGTREDLVFLEVWKEEIDYTENVAKYGGDGQGTVPNTLKDSRVGVETSRRVQLRWRLRVVSGVDFSKNYPSIGSTEYFIGWLNTNDFSSVYAQGANTAVTLPAIISGYEIFRGANCTSPTWHFNSDPGLWVAGSGDAASKTRYGTTDGYVYAIPMFRVHRRNSGGYSVNNANGSLAFFNPVITVPTMTKDLNYQITFNTQADYDNTNIGDVFYHKGDNYDRFRIVSKDGSLKMTVQCLSPLGANTNYAYLARRPKRADNVLVDIVYDRDIIELRHQVSLTGFNYQQLLEENFDKLLRGELQTNAKTSMLKTYHGIAKTPIDANHVFYASLDGTTTAEIGGVPTSVSSSNVFKPMPTGLGLKGSAIYTIDVDSSLTYTFDIIVYIPSNLNSGYLPLIRCEKNGDSSLRLFSLETQSSSSTLQVYAISSLNFSIATPSEGFHHFRIVRKKGSTYLYLDGKLVNSKVIDSSLDTGFASGEYNLSLNCSTTSSATQQTGTIADLAISNIDRGSTFATLPQDFIDGYARIDKAFNSQRQTFSDALTSETKTETVKASGETKKQFIITQATSGTWKSGDTLKVKGLGGEIITGVIDSDTALAKLLTSNASSLTVIPVDNVSKFSIGDVIKIWNVDTGGLGSDLTVTAVDSINNTVTVNTALTFSDTYTRYFIETTASSSAPTVKTTVTGQAQAGASSSITLPTTFNPTDDIYNGLTITITSGTGAGQVRTISDYVGSTKVATVSSAWTTNPDATSIFTISGVAVAGTWSNLGTNEATFTLGTLYALATQDIIVSYSLNEVAGAGGIPEVLTTTLAGESNGKKLTVNPTVHIRDDFAGKVAGNTTVCPNKASLASGLNALATPNTALSEFDDVTLYKAYSSIIKLDGTCSNVISGTAGAIPQQLFSFNLIRILEDKFGPLPCGSDTASKVAWLKANIASIKCNWWGYGSCPSGNKAYLTVWHKSGSWSTYTASTTANSPSSISLLEPATGGANNILNDVCDDGFIYFLVYTDASDGNIASSIFTDYANIEMVLNTPAGYDVLAPENPRRDNGKGNMLLIRKETKEIQSVFNRSNTDSVVTYGDYVPYQGLSLNVSPTDATLSVKAKNKNFIGDVGTGGYKSALTGIKESQLPAGINRSYYMNSNNIGYFKLEDFNSLISSGNDIGNPFVGILRNNFSSSVFFDLFASSSVKKLRGYAPTQGIVRNLDISSILTRLGLSVNSYVATGLIISYQGNAYLVIMRADVNSDKTLWAGSSSTNAAVDVFYLPNRPLIK